MAPGLNNRNLLLATGSPETNFGFSVAISGDRAIIGAKGDNNNLLFTGSAYIFEHVGGTWVEQQELTPSDGQIGDEFGWSVAISGDHAIIGAREDDDNGSSSGSAYIFERMGGIWVEQQKLTPSDGQVLDEFGWSVAISDNRAIVSTYLDDDNGSSSGSAYIFERVDGIWVEQQKLNRQRWTS